MNFPYSYPGQRFIHKFISAFYNSDNLFLCGLMVRLCTAKVIRFFSYLSVILSFVSALSVPLAILSVSAYVLGSLFIFLPELVGLTAYHVPPSVQPYILFPYRFSARFLATALSLVRIILRKPTIKKEIKIGKDNVFISLTDFFYLHIVTFLMPYLRVYLPNGLSMKAILHKENFRWQCFVPKAMLSENVSDVVEYSFMLNESCHEFSVPEDLKERVTIDSNSSLKYSLQMLYAQDSNEVEITYEQKLDISSKPVKLDMTFNLNDITLKLKTLSLYKSVALNDKEIKSIDELQEWWNAAIKTIKEALKKSNLGDYDSNVAEDPLPFCLNMKIEPEQLQFSIGGTKFIPLTFKKFQLLTHPDKTNDICLNNLNKKNSNAEILCKTQLQEKIKCLRNSTVPSSLLYEDESSSESERDEKLTRRETNRVTEVKAADFTSSVSRPLLLTRGAAQPSSKTRGLRISNAADDLD